MRKRIVHIIMLLLIYQHHADAQLLDSLRRYFSFKPSLDWDWDTRNTIITSRRARVSGYKIGLDFASKLKLGMGLNLLDSYHPYQLKNASGESQTASLRMWYPCVYAEYVFHKRKKWTFTVPVQLGWGRAWYQNRAYKPSVRTKSGTIVLYEPCLSGEYRILPWLGLGAEGGFRIVLVKSKLIQERFTAPIYVFSVSIKWGYLMRKYGVYDKVESLWRSRFSAD